MLGLLPQVLVRRQLITNNFRSTRLYERLVVLARAVVRQGQLLFKRRNSRSLAELLHRRRHVVAFQLVQLHVGYISVLYDYVLADAREEAFHLGPLEDGRAILLLARLRVLLRASGTPLRATLALRRSAAL